MNHRGSWNLSMFQSLSIKQQPVSAFYEYKNYLVTTKNSHLKNGSFSVPSIFRFCGISIKKIGVTWFEHATSTNNNQRIYRLCKGYFWTPTKSRPQTKINKRPTWSERRTCISVNQYLNKECLSIITSFISAINKHNWNQIATDI